MKRTVARRAQLAQGAHNKDVRARRYALPRHVVRAVRPSPGRARPAEPGVWLPVPDVDTLPELDELLGDDVFDFLVDSGQTLAIRSLVESELASPDALPTVVLVDEATLPETQPAVALVEPVVPPASEPALVPAPAPFVVLPPDPELAPEWESAPVRSRTAIMVVLRRSRLRRRVRVLSVLTVLVIGALLRVPSLLASPKVTVRLFVDGKTLVRQARAGTVGELLHSAGVRLGSRDRVEPPTSSPIHANQSVRITRAVPITVEVDGVTSTVLTASTTARDLRAQLRLDPKLVARADAVQPGATMSFRTMHHVTVAVDGSTVAVDASARTVGELLADKAIVLGPEDLVAPAQDAVLTDNAQVTVTRVAGQFETEHVAVPVSTQYRKDPTLPIGQSRVLQPGAPGEQLVTYRLTTHDGQAVSRDQVSRVTLRAAAPKIVATGAKPPVSGSHATTSPAVVAAPATRHTQYGGASFVREYPSSTCAHLSIPMGTIVKVTNVATGVWTTCRVIDRGPTAAGRVIDLSHDAFAKLAPPSVGVFPVKLEW